MARSTSWVVILADLAALALGCAVVLDGGPARADGAFPDSQGLLLPSDRPNDIMMATTFGVVVSVDGGQTWTYSCEMMANGALAAFYNIGPAPRDRIFALTDIALIYSDDRACTWNKAGGMLAGKAPVDYFPDAASVDRVWAARAPDTSAGSYTVVESMDGGANFNTLRFTAAVGDSITGVELARSDAKTAYVTLRSGANFTPKLAVTKDGGTTWTTHDLSTMPAIGNANVRLVAIDPSDASKIFLRVSIPSGAAMGDGVALSLDGGATFVSPAPITLPGGALNSFTRMTDGTLLVAGIDGIRNVIFRSTDGGMTFTEISSPLVRGLGQRNGVVFAASSDDVNDPNGFALAQSTDKGTTFQPIMHFADMQAISSCVKTACSDDCNLKVNLGIWDENVCTATAMPKPVDGGSGMIDAGSSTGGSAGGVGGAAGQAGDAGPVDSGTEHVKGTGLFGCSCTAGGAGAGFGGATVAALGLLLLVARPSRRRRS